MKTQNKYLEMLLEFARFGVFTFGGGFSIISQMRQIYVEKKKNLTDEELVDITSVAKSLPGTMIGNVAMLYGWHEGGLLGGLVCIFGMCMPPMAILIAISFGYTAFRDNYWVNAAMNGIQAAVVPIIASAALGLVKGSIKAWHSVLILLVCFVLYLVFQLSAVYLILVGLVSGLVIGEIRERKEAKNHGAA